MPSIFWYQGQAWYRLVYGGRTWYVSPTRIYDPDDGNFIARDPLIGDGIPNSDLGTSAQAVLYPSPSIAKWAGPAFAGSFPLDLRRIGIYRRESARRTPPSSSGYALTSAAPLRSTDPTGLLEIIVDKKNCTFGVRYKVAIFFSNTLIGSWDAEEEAKFRNAYPQSIMGPWNNHNFKLSPDPSFEYQHCCPCFPKPLKPVLDVVVGYQDPDFTIEVTKQRLGFTPYASSYRMFTGVGKTGPTRWYNGVIASHSISGDLVSTHAGVQIPHAEAAHEFGHMIGLSHPSILPWNRYEADPWSIMGRGTYPRLEHFEAWESHAKEHHATKRCFARLTE